MHDLELLGGSLLGCGCVLDDSSELELLCWNQLHYQLGCLCSCWYEFYSPRKGISRMYWLTYSCSTVAAWTVVVSIMDFQYFKKNGVPRGSEVAIKNEHVEDGRQFQWGVQEKEIGTYGYLKHYSGLEFDTKAYAILRVRGGNRTTALVIWDHEEGLNIARSLTRKFRWPAAGLLTVGLVDMGNEQIDTILDGVDVVLLFRSSSSLHFRAHSFCM